MPLTIHALRRADLRENGVLTFEVAGGRYLVADIEGEVHAFAVVGPAAELWSPSDPACAAATAGVCGGS